MTRLVRVKDRNLAIVRYGGLTEISWTVLWRNSYEILIGAHLYSFEFEVLLELTDIPEENHLEYCREKLPEEFI